jgi:hypothetical protein
MHPDNERRLEERVVRAADDALARQQYVSPVDVLLGMGLLSPGQLLDWRRGRIDFLERVIQGNLTITILARPRRDTAGTLRAASRPPPRGHWHNASRAR